MRISLVKKSDFTVYFKAQYDCMQNNIPTSILLLSRQVKKFLHPAHITNKVVIKNCKVNVSFVRYTTRFSEGAVIYLY